MKNLQLTTESLKNEIKSLKAGDRVLLSGMVYTARDAAHAKLAGLLNAGQPLPFHLKGAVIYYAGPTPAPRNLPIGSCGPTTSGRMDSFTPLLLNNGLLATVGKGPRSQSVIDAIVQNGSVYFLALGGAGALAAECVESCEVIAFPELGCESIKRLKIRNFPLYVGVDSLGNNIVK